MSLSPVPAAAALIAAVLAMAPPATANSSSNAADDGSWQQASLIPVVRFAHPRRRMRMARPTAQPTQAPESEEAPEPTPTPTPEASPSPSPEPEMVLPSPDFEAAEDGDVVRPRFDAGLFWPVAAAGTPPARPAPQLGATLWQAHWGLGFEDTIFGDTYRPGSATPYIRANTPLTDVVLRYRTIERALDDERPTAPVRAHQELFAGYRGLGLGDVNFGVAGLAFAQPLGFRDLSVRGRALGGLAVGGAYCLDGRLALAFRSHMLEADLGVRDLVIAGGNLPWLDLWGPMASVILVF